MAGRKPIGDRAMTNAERQKRWRKRHRPSTPSEKFRHKLYFLIRFFALWLSEDEKRRWESLLKKHNGDRKRAAGEMIAMIAA